MGVAVVFCLLLKIFLSNPYWIILDCLKLFVADATMKKTLFPISPMEERVHIIIFPPAITTPFPPPKKKEEEKVTVTHHELAGVVCSNGNGKKNIYFQLIVQCLYQDKSLHCLK